jgi:hypothetical protein
VAITVRVLLSFGTGAVKLLAGEKLVKSVTTIQEYEHFKWITLKTDF